MEQNNVLITGGYGCIGSEAAKWLLRNTSARVVICSRKVSAERTTRVFHDVDSTRLVTIEADVGSQDDLLKILTDFEIDSVVHMAALQTPDCNANRDLGLQINLAGTQNLIEAIKSCGHSIVRFVFASSVAIYGPRAYYPQDQVPMSAEPQPVNVYGVWKLAGEHLARLFHVETGIPTVCLRPGVLYGPGRDAGLTASPTTAMKCLALGIPYEIPFNSRQDYLYAPDVGAAVGHTVMDPFDGFGSFTLPAHSLDTPKIVETLKTVAEELNLGDRFHITVGNQQVPFICDLEYEPFVAKFPGVPHTPLHQALKDSVNTFSDQISKGWLTKESLFPG